MSANYHDCNTIFCIRGYKLIENYSKKVYGKMSQPKMAEFTKVPQAIISKMKTIHDYPNEKPYKPEAETVYKIATAFNVSTDYLLGLTECRQPNNPDIVGYCAELEQRVELLLKKSEAFNEILSSIKSILTNYVSEYDFLVRFNEVDDGNGKVD